MENTIPVQQTGPVTPGKPPRGSQPPRRERSAKGAQRPKRQRPLAHNAESAPSNKRTKKIVYGPSAPQVSRPSSGNRRRDPITKLNSFYYALVMCGVLRPITEAEAATLSQMFTWGSADDWEKLTGSGQITPLYFTGPNESYVHRLLAVHKGDLKFSIIVWDDGTELAHTNVYTLRESNGNNKGKMSGANSITMGLSASSRLSLSIIYEWIKANETIPMEVINEDGSSRKCLSYSQFLATLPTDDVLPEEATLLRSAAPAHAHTPLASVPAPAPAPALVPPPVPVLIAPDLASESMEALQGSIDLLNLRAEPPVPLQVLPLPYFEPWEGKDVNGVAYIDPETLGCYTDAVDLSASIDSIFLWDDVAGEVAGIEDEEICSGWVDRTAV